MTEPSFPSNSNVSKNVVLVTGAAGLLGKELIRQLLEKGFQVIALYHHQIIKEYTDHPNVKLVQGDILDTFHLEQIMLGVQDVYHCAALVSFDPKDTRQLFRINIEGTESVVNAAIAAGIRKLVYVSSVAAMGRIRNNETITEEMQWSEKTSNSNYGKSKYLAEMEVWRGIGEGLNAVIVNPTIILGGDSWEGGSSAIFKTAYEEFPWYTEGISGFVSAKDVVRAMILLMNSDISAERFILNGSNASYRDVFSMIAENFKKKPPHKKVSKFLSQIIWRVEAIKAIFSETKPLLTKETAATAQARVTFDSSKLIRFLPDFMYEPIKETIEETCSKMKAKYNL